MLIYFDVSAFWLELFCLFWAIFTALGGKYGIDVKFSFSRRLTKFGTLTEVKGVYLQGSSTPHTLQVGPLALQHLPNTCVENRVPSRATALITKWGAQRSQVYETSYMRAREPTTKFCMMIKLDNRKFFQCRPRPPSPDRNFLWHECWCAICLR